MRIWLYTVVIPLVFVGLMWSGRLLLGGFAPRLLPKQQPRVSLLPVRGFPSRRLRPGGRGLAA
jgi:hypothetical protein